MKNLKNLSRAEQTKINGGFTQLQIDACHGAAYVCFFPNGAWGCRRTTGGSTCYTPMI
jgi:hypothetical protein